MEIPGMIDEHTFCRTFTAFWNVTTPTSETFVRIINLGLATRVFPSLHGETDPRRRAFVNEFAFCWFKAQGQDSAVGRMSSSEELRAHLANEASRRVFPLRRGDREERATDAEFDEARELARRLASYFEGAGELRFEPPFAGCGILDACRGDLLAEDALYEIKAGERPFRSEDIRQLLTYLALDRASAGQRGITRLGLFNPRLGMEYTCSPRELSLGVSGLEPGELIDLIIYELTRTDVSR